MASEFPQSLDAFRNPTPETATDDPDFSHAAQHANANDAIEALQAKVGVDGSDDPASLDYRIAAVETGKDAAGTASGAVAAHESALDPHPQYATPAEAAAAAPVQSVAGKVGNVTLAKADVGLGNVDNTADADKPVSTAVANALAGKASSGHDHDAAYVNATGDSMTGALAITAANTPQVLTATDSYKEGSQLIPNSEFDDASAWTLAGGWTISGGKLTNPTAVAGNISVPLTGLTAGASYVIEFGIAAHTFYFSTSTDGGTTKIAYWRSFETGAHVGLVAPSANFTLTLVTEYLTAAAQIDYIRMYKVKPNAERVLRGSSASANTFDAVASGTSFGLGQNTLKNSGNAQNSVAIGVNAMAAAVRPFNCVAIGADAMRYSQSPVENIGIGYQTLQNVSTGAGNIIVGNSAGSNLTTGGLNVGIGPRALQAATTASYNFAIGDGSLVQVTTGSDNVAIGLSAGNVFTGGAAKNTLIGARAGRSGTSGAYSSITALGYQAGGAAAYYSNSVCLGHNSVVTGSAQLQLGQSGTTTYAYGAVQDRSDRRDKTDIRPTVLGLKFIAALTPVDFRWDMRDDYRAEVPEEISDRLHLLSSMRPEIADAGGDVASVDTEIADLQAQIDEIAKGNALKNIKRTRDMRRRRFHHGLIAQDVRQVMTALNVDFGGFQDHSLSGGDDVLSLGYTELIGPLIRAVQEQQELIEPLSARLAKIEKGN